MRVWGLDGFTCPACQDTRIVLTFTAVRGKVQVVARCVGCNTNLKVVLQPIKK